MAAPRRQDALSRARAGRSSAICTAFVAPPLRRPSIATQSAEAVRDGGIVAQTADVGRIGADRRRQGRIARCPRRASSTPGASRRSRARRSRVEWPLRLDRHRVRPARRTSARGRWSPRSADPADRARGGSGVRSATRRACGHPRRSHPTCGMTLNAMRCGNTLTARRDRAVQQLAGLLGELLDPGAAGAARRARSRCHDDAFELRRVVERLEQRRRAPSRPAPGSRRCRAPSPRRSRRRSPPARSAARPLLRPAPG